MSNSFTSRAPASRSTNNNRTKSDMWLNLSIVKQAWVDAKPAVKAKAKTSTEAAVKAQPATPGQYVDLLHTTDDPSKGIVAGQPVVINIQKGLGLSSDTKLGRSFIEALGMNPDREFKLVGHVHMVTAESETETYGL